MLRYDGLTAGFRRLGAALAAVTLLLTSGAIPAGAAVEFRGDSAAYCNSGGLSGLLQSAEQAKDQSARREAVAAFLVNLPSTVPPVQWSSPVDVGPYRVSFAKPGRDSSLWDPTFFDGYVSPSDVPVRRLRTHVVTAGQGTPLIGVRQWTSERAASNPNMSPAGYSCPVTAIVDFASPKPGETRRPVVVRLINPSCTDAALAADYTAPLELLLKDAPKSKFAVQAFLRPAEHNRNAGLFTLEPYHPAKIPVVCVHGLDSDPTTWQNVYNELRADPEIRTRYQFWFFRYPTGNPVPVSAALFRESLQAAKAKYDPKGKSKTFNRMVIIGHSMGGLLTRMMVTEPGDAFWSAWSGIPFEQARLADSDRAMLQRALFFHRQPYVKRVVFVATPHRGSRLAEGGVGDIARRLVRIPTEIAALPERILAANPGILRSGLQVRSLVFPTGIDSLKPNNRFVLTLQNLPIEVPCHSIMGNRGIGRGAPSSDGVVPYWSSHLECAESEVLVPSGHSAHENPRAVLELQRILRMHLCENR